MFIATWNAGVFVKESTFPDKPEKNKCRAEIGGVVKGMKPDAGRVGPLPAGYLMTVESR